MSKIQIQLGKSAKNTFTYNYDKNDRDSVRACIKAYNEFYKNYRDTHSISARTWNFPPVIIDGVVKYVVTPNGNWDEPRKEN